ncbi:MAG: carbonic anhydrase [Candidatus Anstonellales archaeon]
MAGKETKNKKYEIEKIIKRLKGSRFPNVLSNKELLESMEKTKEKQEPIAVVLTCSDSRVIPEYIFGAKLGELFVIRTAGNMPDKNSMASIEYALEHLKVKVIVVLGHTNCGAVKGAIALRQEMKKWQKDSFLPYLLDSIAENIKEARNVDEAIYMNAKKIKGILEEKLKKYEVKIVPAIYDIGDGSIKWLDS